jgi:microsomal dipeptidase-like Zn-dependent dipeptidase
MAARPGSSKAPPNDDLANAMQAGSLAVACLADVPDGPILGRNAQVLVALRTPEPGELYRHHLERLAWLDEMVAHHGLRRALCAADLEAAHKAGQPAIVADVEGLDFLDGKLERLDEAYQRGIRHLQLVHYTPNDIGDFQTGAVMHQGLTSFGDEVIRVCHRLGFVCDVAHATYREGAENGRVMCLSLHPHNIGRPNAAKHLDEALRYILGHDGVWNTTADDIAEYYIANYYDQVSSWIAEHKAQA